MSTRLRDVSVVVTRAADSADALNGLLLAEGATLISVPLIGVDRPEGGFSALEAAIGSLADGDVVAVTSARGAVALLEVCPDGPPCDVRLVVVGPATAGEFESSRWSVDLMPRVHTASALAEALGSPTRTRRVLYVAAAEPRPDLRDGLLTSGWVVDQVAAYRTILLEPDQSVVSRACDGDVIVFTSGSTVEAWNRVAPRDATPTVVSFGPATSAAACGLGIEVGAEARRQTLDSLVEAVVLAATGASEAQRTARDGESR